VQTGRLGDKRLADAGLTVIRRAKLTP